MAKRTHVPTTRPKVSREGFTEKRKAPRQVHRIDHRSTDRDVAIARADLTNFFEDIVEKHHGGW